jgi:hypothetical protein
MLTGVRPMILIVVTGLIGVVANTLTRADLGLRHP